MPTQMVSSMTEEHKKEFMIREMEMLQGIISRLSTNAFAVKGWAITLVVGILLLRGPPQQVLIAFIPVFCFWYLDAYFLSQEKKYRAGYDWVLKNRQTSDEYLFDMRLSRFDAAYPVINTMFSKTLVVLYGTIAVATALYYVSLVCSHADACLVCTRIIPCSA